MSTLLVVLLVVIIVLAISQAGQKARSARRAAEDHQRALDTLGHITGHPAEESGEPPADGEAAARPHVRVLASQTPSRQSRWSRRVIPPPAVPTVPPPPPPPAAGGPTSADPAGGDSPPTMEVAVPAFPPQPHLAPHQETEAAERGPAIEPVASEPVAPEPVAPEPVPSEAAVDGAVVRIDDLAPEPAGEGDVVRIDDLTEPAGHFLAGSPRSPSAEVEAPPAVARVLNKMSPAEPGRARRRRHRPPAKPRFGRHKARRAPAGSRRRAAVWISGVSVVALIAAAGTAVALGVGSGHANRDTASPPVTNPQPVTTTTLPPPPPAVRLVSSTSAQATYDVVGSPVTRLVASGRCWVEVRQGDASGKVLFVGVMTAGQSKDLAGPLWLRLGYPQAVTVTVNGTALNAPGLSSGQPYNLAVG